MPLQATSGAASYDAFGGGVVAEPNYIESVFQTYLYTGNGSTQTITNGLDLSTKGGLVWTKDRTQANNNVLQDTVRGVASVISSNLTAGDLGYTNNITAFGSTGYSIGVGSEVNNSGGGGSDYVSWTFREQAKFFDVVTYTGTGSTRTVAHNLGSVPGCIIIKNLSDTDGWLVYHRSIGATKTLCLNTTGAAVTDGATYFNATEPTSTVFTVKEGGKANASSNNYVAYVFAHNAGGFGLSGADNVITCGSYTTNGSGQATVDLGYEPQWLLTKGTSSGEDWFINDNMRGLNYTRFVFLNPNYNSVESGLVGNYFAPTATGFTVNGASGSTTYVYIAIRRGPMKVPTSGTSVYNAVSRTGTGTAATITGIGFAPDLLDNQRTTAGSYTGFFDRLRGAGKLLYRALDDAETTVANQTTQFNTTMDGFAVGSSTASDSGNNNTVPYIWHCYKRAPSVFDIVCYTGNGSTQNVNHNLGVAPELMIVKSRSLSGSDWWVYASPLTTPQNKYLRLQSTGGESTVSGLWGSSLPTSTTFGLGAFAPNSNGATFVAYLFATCAGVSKVGSYTGTATTKQIDCGFTGGARFVLIKRTDSTGDWYVWDSARGIVSGNDPYLLLNSTAAEVTNTDYIDTYSAGFEISSTAPAAINASGGIFMFLAIA